jgi:hypothetical protein
VAWIDQLLPANPGLLASKNRLHNGIPGLFRDGGAFDGRSFAKDDEDVSMMLMGILDIFGIDRVFADLNEGHRLLPLMSQPKAPWFKHQALAILYLCSLNSKPPTNETTPSRHIQRPLLGIPRSPCIGTFDGISGREYVPAVTPN